MGEPNATATPAALDAVKISRIFTACQHGRSGALTLAVPISWEESCNNIANCTGDVHGGTLLAHSKTRPNGQRLRVSDAAHQLLTRVMALRTSVSSPRNPLIMKPPRMHLISEIPEPAAYGAKLRTRYAAVNANMACGQLVNGNEELTAYIT